MQDYVTSCCATTMSNGRTVRGIGQQDIGLLRRKICCASSLTVMTRASWSSRSGHTNGPRKEVFTSFAEESVHFSKESFDHLIWFVCTNYLVRFVVLHIHPRSILDFDMCGITWASLWSIHLRWSDVCWKQLAVGMCPLALYVLNLCFFLGGFLFYFLFEPLVAN